jgi:hypothetical protein
MKKHKKPEEQEIIILFAKELRDASFRIFCFGFLGMIDLALTCLFSPILCHRKPTDKREMPIPG